MIVAIASFSKCVRFIMFSKRKAGVFKFFRFEECFSDGRLNRSKVHLSNISDVVWTGH